MDAIDADKLSAALNAETEARKAVVAIGEQWKAIHKARRKLTNDERDHHRAAVRAWMKAAVAVGEIIDGPLK
jgi:hypothetical protein